MGTSSGIRTEEKQQCLGSALPPQENFRGPPRYTSFPDHNPPVNKRASSSSVASKKSVSWGGLYVCQLPSSTALADTASADVDPHQRLPQQRNGRHSEQN